MDESFFCSVFTPLLPLPQAKRANEITEKAGMADKVSFQVFAGFVCMIDHLRSSYTDVRPLLWSSTRTRFSQVGDALNQPFPDSSFDLVWSMESGEHMPDKK